MDNPPDKPMKIMDKGIQIQTSIKGCPHCSLNRLRQSILIRFA